MREETYFFKRNINRLHLLMLLGMACYTLMGGSTAYGYLACLAVLAFFLRDEISLQSLFEKKRSMTPLIFFQLLSLTQTLNFTHIVWNEFSELILNGFGLTAGGFLHENMAVWTYEPTPFHEVLLFGFFGPVVEELTMRGYLMRSYREYSGSKVYAIVFSAILFGVFHSNFHTSVPIIFDAIVLGYIATEYGIVWTMIYHMIENFVISHLFVDGILMQLPSALRFPVGFLVFSLIAVCALMVLIRNRRGIFEYIEENRCEKSHIRLTLRSPVFCFAVVLFTLLSLRMISVL